MLYFLKIIVIYGSSFIVTFHLVLGADVQDSALSFSDNLGSKFSKTVCSLTHISDIDDLIPGVYESDSIENILSVVLSKFGEEDLVVFDIDQTLTVHLLPYLYAQQLQDSRFLEKLRSQSSIIKQKVETYAFCNLPFNLMDEKIPELIRNLQEKNIKCISNTAMSPVLHCDIDIDVSALRVKYLRELGIDFSQSFPYLHMWDFCLEGGCVIEEYSTEKDLPVFKEGVILSAFFPKYVTLLELMKKLHFIPKRVVFIDDSTEHCHRMHEALTSQGIENYSFIYSKFHHTTLLDYFSFEVAMFFSTKLEDLLEKLINGENVDEYLPT